MVLFFLGFGVVKFTAGEATAIHPLLVHSPFLFWLPQLVNPQLASDIIGVVEIALALMMASRFFLASGLRPWEHRHYRLFGHHLTTPGLESALGAFIIKDITLLGVAQWSAGEALAATQSLVRSRDAFVGQPAPARS